MKPLEHQFVVSHSLDFSFSLSAISHFVPKVWVGGFLEMVFRFVVQREGTTLFICWLVDCLFTCWLCSFLENEPLTNPCLPFSQARLGLVDWKLTRGNHEGLSSQVLPKLRFWPTAELRSAYRISPNTRWRIRTTIPRAVPIFWTSTCTRWVFGNQRARGIMRDTFWINNMNGSTEPVDERCIITHNNYRKGWGFGLKLISLIDQLICST